MPVARGTQGIHDRRLLVPWEATTEGRERRPRPPRIAREPREFTIVNIVGSINPKDLPELESHLHLPKIGALHPDLLM